MTVNELIEKLQNVKDKEKQVAVYSMFGSFTWVFDVIESEDQEDIELR